MSGIEYRYRIEMRIAPDGEWLNSGLAIKPESGVDGAVVVIAGAPIKDANHGVLHVSESNIFDPRRETLEDFNGRQRLDDDLETMRREVDGLKAHVAALTSKCRVMADFNLAHSLRDLDRRGMV